VKAAIVAQTTEAASEIGLPKKQGATPKDRPLRIAAAGRLPTEIGRLGKSGQ